MSVERLLVIARSLPTAFVLGSPPRNTMGVGLKTGPHVFIKSLSIIFSRENHVAKSDYSELSNRASRSLPMSVPPRRIKRTRIESLRLNFIVSR